VLTRSANHRQRLSGLAGFDQATRKEMSFLLPPPRLGPPQPKRHSALYRRV